MPIEVKCQGCGRLLRGPDKMAGKKVKCPNCSAILSLPNLPTDKPAKKPATGKPATGKPATERSAAEKPGAETEWFMQTDDGEEYGPVTKDELDQWVQDGRIDSSCQLLREGWEQWKWAEETYPELAQADGAETETQEMFAGISDSGPHAAKKNEDEEVNPFESPRQSAGIMAGGEDELEGQSGISARSRQALVETRPWVTFMAILGFVIGAIWLLVPVVLLVMSLTSFSLSGVVVALLAFTGPALYLYAAYLLFNYGRSIGVFLRSGAGQHLEDALVSQKSFWKLIGIVTAIILALYAILFLIMIVGMVFAAGAGM